MFAILIGLPVVQAMWAGFVGAATVDIIAFRSWKSWDDAAAFDWHVATLRWVQGIGSGFLGHVGILAVQAALP